ncbi:endonuclease [Craterilacuibacter sp.]|uniref:endonuclease n=1 Tax=Craterilacuibacter sp. TaxID=2870909 RepID=UPI003F3B044E
MKFWLIPLFSVLLAACSGQGNADTTASTKAAPAAQTAGISLTDPIVLVSGKNAVGPRNFNNAKKVLPTVFAGMQNDFYCGCPYTGKSMDLEACGYQVRKNLERAGRLEWEHVVPAWVLGHQRQCWQQGGRKNCTSTDDVFRMAEGDLVNLVPSVGEVNGDRSNYAYGAWTRNPEPMYGQCQTIVDFKGRRAQPREEVRGRIARIYFYMHGRYGLKMSRQDTQLMCAWAKTYPVDAWETSRDARIIKLQGSGNPYVQDARLVAAFCGKPA